MIFKAGSPSQTLPEREGFKKASNEFDIIFASMSIFIGYITDFYISRTKAFPLWGNGKGASFYSSFTIS
jgi:formate-dependent nitrite reductase membrane component NrfD